MPAHENINLINGVLLSKIDKILMCRLMAVKCVWG